MPFSGKKKIRSGARFFLTGVHTLFTNPRYIMRVETNQGENAMTTFNAIAGTVGAFLVYHMITSGVALIASATSAIQGAL